MIQQQILYARPAAELPETLVGQEIWSTTWCAICCRVASLVNELPEPYREAVRMTEHEGLSHKPLSEQLDISFSGAKSRVQRARAKIKQALLECCHFQFAHVGRLIDYQPHCACCAEGARASSC
jgi:RNA polymerase sigma-70 factor (ECF subfamily)